MSSALAVRAPEAPSHGSSRVGAGRYPNTTPGTGEPHAAHRSFDATPLRLVALAHAMRHASGDRRRYRGSWRAAPSIAAAKPVLEPLVRRVCASNVRSKPGGSPPDFGTTPRPRKGLLRMKESKLHSLFSRKKPGLSLTPRLLVVRRRGNGQHAAHRLDPVFLPVLVDQRHHHLGRRSSSACAKKPTPCEGFRGATKLMNLALQLLDPRLVLGGRPGAFARVTLRLTDPLFVASQPCSPSFRRPT